MAAEHRSLANNLRSNGRIFKILMAYVHYCQYIHLEIFFNENPLKFDQKVLNGQGKLGLGRITRVMFDLI